MPSETGRDDRVTYCLKLPFLDLGKACANVFGKSAIDGYAGHAVGWVSEPLEMGVRFTHALEGCRIAGLHVDADNFPRVIAHRGPESAMTMLHRSLLDVWEVADWGSLPLS